MYLHGSTAIGGHFTTIEPQYLVDLRSTHLSNLMILIPLIHPGNYGTLFSLVHTSTLFCYLIPP